MKRGLIVKLTIQHPGGHWSASGNMYGKGPGDTPVTLVAEVLLKEEEGGNLALVLNQAIAPSRLNGLDILHYKNVKPVKPKKIEAGTELTFIDFFIDTSKK